MTSNKSVTIRKLDHEARQIKPIKELGAISSKSFLHRALICASLAKGRSIIYYRGLSEDIIATIGALGAFGARISIDKDYISLEPIPSNCIATYENLVKESDTKSLDSVHGFKLVNCGESGSTLRMLLPMATRLSDDYIFTGKEGLMARPIGDLTRVLRENGSDLSSDRLPIKIRNKSGLIKIKNNKSMSKFQIRGDVSSQYISGLLLAGPLMHGDTRVDVLDKIESKPYIDLTKDVMNLFGVEVEEFDINLKDDIDKETMEARTRIVKSYKLKSGQFYKPCCIRAEADWSNSCFFLALGALFREIRLLNLDMTSSQGDKRIIEILKWYGAGLLIKDSYIEVRPGKRRAINLDISDTPDMLPILAILAIFAEGQSSFTGIERLRIKESDRIESVIRMVEDLGAKAWQENNKLIVSGEERTEKTSYRINSFNDHRIVMAASIGGSLLGGDLIIEGAEAVNKSYPDFFKDLKKFGFEVRWC